ncbi:response regulator [Desulforhopalus sp. IMCC35007]|uniref:hybrid sensor histidine kinase/response regulator n=1 Tax=Desulforhopalus sp. IMCC35007 TaxID=2569543 RepID=UPI0010AE1C2F|nr:response regulator [Desulforhopalus sp. IMCC35007]TKB10408.1 response regulator [Desulforhopalus sp. IMCC35007]
MNESKKKLIEANNTLESKVLEKTEHLNKAIQNLLAEIDKREEAEKELLKTKKEWQEIFEAIGHMTMILDKDHKIIAANRATLNQTGLTLENIVGQTCNTIFHNSDSTAPGCPFSEILKSGELEVTEAEVQSFGRTYIVSCTPICNEEGQLEKVIHISTDITARKKLQKELIQAHKMEAIGSLAGGIAHDFNNILSVVLGYTDMSLKRVEKDSPLEEDLQQVYIAGIRAKNLVKQILNFARKTDEKPAPVRVDLVVKEVIKFLRSTIPASVEIRENIFSSSLVLANPVKIHQLVMNLCTNASYAMNENGLLELSLRDVVMKKSNLPISSEMQPGLYQCFEISDNGCGIPAEILQSIFEPFFTTKGIQEGTGMGLATVQNIVKECNGHISVKSQVGHGTVFTILLPTTTQEDKKEDCKNDGELPSGRERILLIDDELTICKIVSRMLESQGYVVSFETNSEKAVKLFRADPNLFDLVITDMTMPKMPGDLVTCNLLAIRPDIPVIIATGYNKRITDNAAIDIGAKAFLPKPFEKATLIQMVRKVLDEYNPDKQLST